MNWTAIWLLPGKEMARQWEQFKAGGFLDDGFVEEYHKLEQEAQQLVNALEEKNLQLGQDRD